MARTAGNGAGLDPHLPVAARSVESVCSVGILSCPARAALHEVARLMEHHGVHALVVEGGEANAVVSDVDLMSALASEHFDQLTAADIAGTRAFGVSPKDSLGAAAKLLSRHRVGHLIVRAGAAGEPIGVLSTLDIARAIARAKVRP